MPKRSPLALTPLAVLIPPIVARAMGRPSPPAAPVAAAPVRRYRQQRCFRHPSQLPCPAREWWRSTGFRGS